MSFWRPAASFRLLGIAVLMVAIIRPGQGMAQLSGDCDNNESPMFSGPYLALPTRPNPYTVVVADFDGDGKGDVAETIGGDNRAHPIAPGGVRFQFADGNDRFRVVDIDVSDGYGVFQSLDLNGDGRADLAYSSLGEQTTQCIGFPVGRTPSLFFAHGAYYHVLGAGDIDGDGKDELFGAGSDKVWLLARHGVAIAPTLLCSLPVGVSRIQIGRFDDDVLPDLFVLANQVYVARNLGNSFASPLALGDQRGNEMFVKDFDRDGLADVLIYSGYPNYASIALSTSRTEYRRAGDMNEISKSMAVGDQTGDGLLDVLFLNSDGGLRLLRGQAGGQFAAAEGIACGDYLQSIATGDIDGDGTDDIAALSLQDRVFIRKGHPGSFEIPMTLPVGLLGFEARIADADGDGQADLFVRSDKIMQLHLREGPEAFAAGRVIGTGASLRRFEVLDLDGDERADVLSLDYATRTLTVKPGDAGGAWDHHADYPLGPGANDFNVGDLNGDTRPDIAVSGEGQFDSRGHAVGLGWLAILWNRGDGLFSLPDTIDASRRYSFVEIGDLDSDGTPDVVTIVNRAVTYQRGLSGGEFAPVQEITGVNCLGVPLLADVNGDDITDLLTGWNGATVRLGQGGGVFGEPSTYPTGSWPLHLVASDFDRDGRLDLLTPCLATNELTVLLGDGRGGFPCSYNIQVGQQPHFAQPADFNGDGLPDILTGATQTALQILPNRHSSLVPVVAVSFMGASVGRSIELTWSISGEPPSFFHVRRLAGDGKWPVVGTVSGQGPDYRLVDHTLAGPGVYRYELHEIARDGSDSRVAETTIDFSPGPSRGAQLAAWPNPFREVLHIDSANTTRGPVSVRVFDIQGRLVFREEGFASAPDGFTMNWDGVFAGGMPAPPGVYIATIQTSEGTRQVARVVRVH